MDTSQSIIDAHYHASVTLRLDRNAEMDTRQSIIAVHGVGDQIRGQIAKELAGALASELCLTHTADQEVVVRYGGQVRHLPPSAPQTVASETYLLEWRERGEPRRLSVYEFYWADESRRSEGLKGLLDRVWSYWQLFVGLPRLGLRSLDGPAGPAWVFVRALYCLAWFALVLRLLFNVLFSLIAVPGLSQAF